jgi:hypothetical protein
MASIAVAKKAKKKAFSLTFASSETFSGGKSMMDVRCRRLENLLHKYLQYKYGNLVAHLQNARVTSTQAKFFGPADTRDWIRYLNVKLYQAEKYDRLKNII